MKKVLSIILCAVIAVSCMSFSVSAKAVKVRAPRMASVTNIDTDMQKVKWTKVSGISGYQLYCKAGSGGFKKIKTLGKNTTSFINKKLTAGKKYFYKVRAYKKVKGKTKCSKYSAQLGKKCTNYLMDLYSPYSKNSYREYKSGDYFYMGGDKYSNGFTLDSISYSIFNLKGKYSRMVLTVGIVDGSTVGGTFSVYSDDSCVASYDLEGNSLPKTYSIDIENANKLEIKKINGYWATFGFANIKLYK